MKHHELVMAERPYWRTILHDGGPGPMIVAVEETSYAEINGRTARAEIAVFDTMMAEIIGEKDARLQKFLRKHEVRHGKPIRKEKRKAYIKEKCYSCDPWHGLDTVRKFREIEAEKADARDYEIELRNIADDTEQR